MNIGKGINRDPIVSNFLNQHFVIHSVDQNLNCFYFLSNRKIKIDY